jgi:hypothetical protein
MPTLSTPATGSLAKPGSDRTDIHRTNAREEGKLVKAIIIDQFHVTVLVKHGLPETEYDAIHRTLDKARFHVQLRRAVRAVIQQFPSLTKVRVTVTR